MNALILVDIQNDFLPGGALAVPNGDEVIPVANELSRLKGPVFDLVVMTQDWHPPDHVSFASNHDAANPFDVIEVEGDNQVLWPDHCVQGSDGAEFGAELDARSTDAIIRKGTNKYIDSYSGFADNALASTTGLAGYLHAHGARRLFVMGLATDYCVQFTALHGVKEFETTVITDGCRGIDDEGVEKAMAAMRGAGIEFVTSDQLIPTITEDFDN